MSQPSPSEQHTTGFGANEWLVDELYQQYLEDKSSVDRAWWDFFADYQPPEVPRVVSSTRASTDRGTDRSAGQDAGTGSGNGAPAAPDTTKERPVPGRHAAAGTAQAPPQPRREPSDDQAGRTGPRDPATRPADTAEAPPADGGRPAPRDIPVKPSRSEPARDGEVQRLRGPAARVAANMEASRELPTATSVRAVPAKLLIDNRIVINNHLKRARGGKVSFTHLIGFALVEALDQMPEMNASYTEEDGKPAIARPAHVNLGIAIDLAKDDGTRQLLVPSDQAVRDDGLRRVLARLRGRGPARAHRQAHRRRLRRHDA